MSLQKLREEYSAKAAKAREILDRPKDQWTVEAAAEVDAIYAELDKIQAQIDRYEALVKRTDDLEASARGRSIVSGRSVDEEAHRISVERRAFGAWARMGREALQNVSDEQVKQQIQLGFRLGVQNIGMQNAAVGTNTAGGYTVETDVAADVIQRLKAYGGVRNVATLLPTAQGNPILYPTTDDTANSGELLAEAATAATQDVTFGAVTIGAYKWSSKVVPVSIELLQDSAVDIEGLILGLISTRLGRVQNTYFTTGTGTAQPLGVATAAASGGSKVGATGQTTSVTYDDLVDVEHSVDPAYRQRGTCGWMFNDSTLKVMKKLKDTMNRPLWRPAVTGGDAADILGYRYDVNQDMPTMAANAKSIIFGDFSRYIVRDVMQVTMMRFDDSAYASKGQVGFLAFQRSDGKWVDSGNAAIAYYQNSAT